MGNESPVGIRARRPEQESMLRSSERLAAVVAAPQATDEWYALAHRALRDCISAVESRIQNLSGPDGIGGDISRREPRLIRAIEQLEADLARLLLDFWEAKRMQPSERPAFVPRLAALAVEIRHAADDEWDLVAESQTATGTQD
ncbi:MAG: hypothetical protein HYX53_14565 [Chloroflexi bacterium]|nr:hypothetical protein [Chloroflexota bacterium]